MYIYQGKPKSAIFLHKTRLGFINIECIDDDSKDFNFSGILTTSEAMHLSRLLADLCQNEHDNIEDGGNVHDALSQAGNF